MYKYTEEIGGLTRTYEAESPEKVVELVLAVTIDIQSEINKRQREKQQLTGVDIVLLKNQINHTD
ncbi:hypothetical protein [Pelosinus propionicus]|uniref:Uncharacterized protein n=1 Tax=Pelosinus propionicus DSM 13327 TaxID=1123291 RepID=A0A1I4QCH2_9FIRM|nr:hypothetical protein [Pelosinus propionicus]SFM37749.1 hypothetical protein SAMN04490355_109412 [Pelosinus propionicus DSM 13327]